MELGPAIGYGLASSAGAGSADYLAKTTADRVGPLATLWFLELFGAPLLVTLALLSDGIHPLPWGAVLGLAALSLVSVSGLFFLYRAFELGRLAVVAPLTSGYPALTVVLSVVLLGESLSPLETLGIGAVLLGVLLIARRAPKGALPAKDPWGGILAAGIAFVLFGVYYFGLAFVIGPVPAVTGAAITRLVGVVTVGAIVLLRGGLWLPPSGLRSRAVAYPVLDSFALVAYNVGWVFGGSMSILVTVSGLYGAVTLGWAVILLKDRPSRGQWLGALLIFLGVAALSLAAY